MKIFQEFKDFAMRGNVVDMAVGIIIGGAFGKIVTSLVNDVVMPPIGLLLGNMDFSNLSIILRKAIPANPSEGIAAAEAVKLQYGAFINTTLNFLIVAACIFAVIKAMNRLQRQKTAAEPTTKDCPHCLSSIPIKATRCPHCTSELETP